MLDLAVAFLGAHRGKPHVKFFNVLVIFQEVGGAVQHHPSRSP